MKEHAKTKENLRWIAREINDALPIFIFMALVILAANLLDQNPLNDSLTQAQTNAGFFTGVYHGLIAPATAVSGIFVSDIAAAEKHDKTSPYIHGYMVGLCLLPAVIIILSNFSQWRKRKFTLNCPYPDPDRIGHPLRRVMYGYAIIMSLLAVLLITKLLTPSDISAPIMNFKTELNTLAQVGALVVLMLYGFVYILIFIGHLIVGVALGQPWMGITPGLLYGFPAVTMLFGIWISPILMLGKDTFGHNEGGGAE